MWDSSGLSVTGHCEVRGVGVAARTQGGRGREPGGPMWRRSLALGPWWAGPLLQQRFCSPKDREEGEDGEEGEDSEDGEVRGFGATEGGGLQSTAGPEPSRHRGHSAWVRW